MYLIVPVPFVWNYSPQINVCGILSMRVNRSSKSIIVNVHKYLDDLPLQLGIGDPALLQGLAYPHIILRNRIVITMRYDLHGREVSSPSPTKYRAPRTMPVSTRDWLSVQMMAVFERDFPPGWLPFVHSTPLS